ncbi:MAG: hypothetical protein K6B64_02785 [Acholeplasmatales bacterium]|nr:hypothetical protein [Acholeplasmatales bacterium]
MDIQLLKSFLDADLSPIVMCDTNYVVAYMNDSAAKYYNKVGGYDLVGKSLLSIHNAECIFKITEVAHWFSMSKENNIVRTFYNEKTDSDLYMIAIRNEKGELIGFSEKQEKRNKDDISFYQF